MNISPEWTLAEIVNRVVGAPRVLERLGLDYCCGGQQTLQRACDAAAIDVVDVVQSLAALEVAEAPEWVGLEPAQLVDHLESTHHAYLHAELPRLQALSRKVAGVHGANHPELAEVAELCDALHDDLEPHMMKEERVLFPMVRELATATVAPSFHCGSVANPISMMMLEHERTGELLERLRRTTDDYRVPDDGCASYRVLYESLEAIEADTHLHVHKENNSLFPAVLELEQRWSPVG